MADQGGISKVTTTANQVTATQPRAGGVTANASKGAGRREVPEAGRQKLVNFEGQILNRAAPRGTYLNIIV